MTGNTVRTKLQHWVGLAVAAWLLTASAAQAQQPVPPWAQATAPPPAYPRPANSLESNALYGAAALYGLSMGIWLDVEAGISDPGVRLIPPMVLGVTAPVTAYVLNRPPMPRGVPGSIAAGITVGLSEGAAIFAVQSARPDSSWGLRAFARSLAIGSTAGAVGGYFMGQLQQPSPNISAFAASASVWGAVIGGAHGLAVADDHRPREYDDTLSMGVFLGLNGGLLVSMGLSTLFVPTVDQLTWMWAGAGIGALVSAPAYLFYLPDDAPPARRGLTVTATAMTLGIIVGGVFGPDLARSTASGPRSDVPWFAELSPMPVPGGMGMQWSGSWN